MKDNIISVFLAIFIFIVIAVTVILSMDLCGVISLPEQMSLKTYLSNTVEVMGRAQEEEIYYPDYEATGVQNLVSDNTVSNTSENEIKTDLSEYINSNTQNTSNNNGNKITNNITDNSFYYNQLDTYGKTIYSKLVLKLKIKRNL